MSDIKRYARTDGKAGTVEAVALGSGDSGAVREFTGSGSHEYDKDSGVHHLETRRGLKLPVPDGSYLLRDERGHISHMTADAFKETFEPAKDGGKRASRSTGDVGGGPSTAVPGAS